jgi:cell division protein FtsN
VAQRKRRRSSRSRKQEYPGWMWMLFGLAIGLSVAFAVYVKDRGPTPPPVTPEPASLQSALDDNGETEAAVEAADKPERRFTFYDVLPNFEVTVPDETPNVTHDDIEPQAVVEPGLYILQAGSFSTPADADRRRAQLALQGIDSHIQRVKVNEKNYYRVNIGPTDDLDELNLWRSQLRVAKIDVLRIRLSDE